MITCLFFWKKKHNLNYYDQNFINYRPVRRIRIDGQKWFTSYFHTDIENGSLYSAVFSSTRP